MIVSRLSLTDFRNYTSVDLDLVAGPNLFVGDNGQGKTNLVESLGYLSTLSSHRVSSEQAMIRQGADSAIIRARVRHDSKELLLEVQLNRVGANRAQLNKNQIKVRELPRYLHTVLFAPEDLALVMNSLSYATHASRASSLTTSECFASETLCSSQRGHPDCGVQASRHWMFGMNVSLLWVQNSSRRAASLSPSFNHGSPRPILRSPAMITTPYWQAG